MKVGALFLAGVAAALPSAAAFSEAMAAPSTNASSFAPTSNPLILTRTVWRELQDGKEIVARRRYAVRIMSDGAGFTVVGEQIDSAVEAPAALAALAEMERRRSEVSLFPMQLDANGQILAEQRGFDPAARSGSVRVAQQFVQASDMANADKVLTGSLIDQIAKAGGIAQWPSDLFNPTRQNQQEIRCMALPGGMEGEVTISITVHGQLQGGLPRAVERMVVTKLEGTRKVTREQWTLEISGNP